MPLFEIALVAGLTAIAIRLLISHAAALRLVDEPNHRSVHEHPVPRGAGIAFVGVALCDILVFHFDMMRDHIPLLLSLLMVLGVGILDDRHEAAPRLKFMVIGLATLALWDGGMLIDEEGKYFGFDIRFGWLGLPFTFFALAGFTNALNLVDGLDGLAGTISLVILLAFGFLGMKHGDALLIWFSLAFSASLTVFLFFNRNPASVFMGDSGSLTLGFLISLLSIRALEYLPSVSILYIGAVPLIDTLTVMIRRRKHGRSASAPDRCHLHHLLLKRTGNVSKTVLMLGSAQILFTIVGMILPKGHDQTLFLAIFLAIVLVMFRFIDRMMNEMEMECY